MGTERKLNRYISPFIWLFFNSAENEDDKNANFAHDSSPIRQNSSHIVSTCHDSEDYQLWK